MEILTTKQAAKMLGVKPQTAVTILLLHKIPYQRFKVSGPYLWDKNEVEALIQRLGADQGVDHED